MSTAEPTVLIPLRACDDSVRAYAIVDAADEALVNKRRWHLHSKGYAAHTVHLGSGRANRKTRAVLLHRFLLGLEPGDPRQGDHKNRMPLDCRRANLRIVTSAQNGQNVGSLTGSTSVYRGVSWNTARKKWKAYAHLNGRQHHLGCFDDELHAAAVAAGFRCENMLFSHADSRKADRAGGGSA